MIIKMLISIRLMSVKPAKWTQSFKRQEQIEFKKA